jgi:hypothetical protein
LPVDQQLRFDSELGMVKYQVLAALSEAPERTMRMSSLAVLSNASLSLGCRCSRALKGGLGAPRA